MAHATSLGAGVLACHTLIDRIAAAGLRFGELLHLGRDAGDLFLVVEDTALGGDNADRDAHQAEAPQDAVAIGGGKVAAPAIFGVV